MSRAPAACVGLMAAALALAACGAASDAGPDAAAAEAACAAATAVHVGKPVETVTAAWAGAAAGGGGTVIVTDAAAEAGERIYACDVRADGSLAGLRHTAR